MFVGGCGARSSSTTKLPPKGDLLHYIKDLRVEKWEGADATKVMTQTNVKSASDCRGERQFVVQSEYRPEGVIDLNWTRDGEVVSLSTKLAELLGDMKSLEKFWYHTYLLSFSFICFFLSCIRQLREVRTIANAFVCSYNPQRYISIPDGPPPGEPEPIFHVNGITAEIFTVLKSLPHLRNLLINFSLWDPLDRTTEGFAVLARTSGYKGAITGLTGFKDLEELVIFGVCADRRFSEIGKVVGKCMFSIPFKRRLKWLEVRVDEPWYDDLQDSGHINSTQDLWDWAVSLWGKLFGAAESLRCSGGLDGVDIDFLLEFGPIRWQWKCPKLAGLICRPENLTVLNLRGVDEKQILGTIKRLAIMGTPSLEIFAVECRLTELNNVLKRFCGLRELYVFEPDAKERYEARNELRPNYKPLVGSRGVSYEKPVDIKGIQWALDTISKFHLITLKVLVIEEIICPPRINCASTTINNIGGWRERGGNLRELGVHLWGPWEEIGEFLTAFGGLKSFHLFNCQRPEGLFHDEYGHFIKAARTAVMIANLWGREVICARKKVKPTMLEENRWIGVGPHFLDMVETWRWKWRIDDALKYVNGEGVLMYAGKAVKRPWEEGGRMWVVLRKGGVLTREDW